MATGDKLVNLNVLKETVQADVNDLKSALESESKLYGTDNIIGGLFDTLEYKNVSGVKYYPHYGGIIKIIGTSSVANSNYYIYNEKTSMPDAISAGGKYKVTLLTDIPTADIKIYYYDSSETLTALTDNITSASGAVEFTVPANAVGLRIALFTHSSAGAMDGYCYINIRDTETIYELNDAIGEINGELEQVNGELEQIGDSLDTKAGMAAVSPVFSESSTYKAGEYVWNNEQLYRFTVDHAAGNWIGTDAVQAVLGNDIYNFKSADEATGKLYGTDNLIGYLFNALTYGSSANVSYYPEYGGIVRVKGTSSATNSPYYIYDASNALPDMIHAGGTYKATILTDIPTADIKIYYYDSSETLTALTDNITITTGATEFTVPDSAVGLRITLFTHSSAGAMDGYCYINIRETSTISELDSKMDGLSDMTTIPVYNLTKALVDSNVLFCLPEKVMPKTQKYYVEIVYSIPVSALALNDMFVLTADSVENATASSKYRIRALDSNETVITTKSGADSANITVDQSIIDGGGRIVFELYPAAATALTLPAIYKNVVVYQPTASVSESVQYDFKEPITKYITQRIESYNSLVEGASTYTGEKIDLSRNICKLEKYMDVKPRISGQLQGGACYGNYYFQFVADKLGFSMYDLFERSFVATASTDTTLTDWHNNNVCFGTEFYNNSDEFPLVYLSSSLDTANFVAVCRIVNNNGAYSLEHVQTITWEDAATISAHNSECVIDTDNNHLIRISYTIGAFSSDANNRLKIDVFDLPLLSAGNITLLDSSKLDTFEVARTHTLQGAVYCNQKVYILFGNSSDAYLKIIDLTTKEIVTTVKLTVPAFGDLGNVEPEAAFVYNGYLFGVVQGSKMWRMIV